jgi:hypothetical protein
VTVSPTFAPVASRKPLLAIPVTGTSEPWAVKLTTIWEVKPPKIGGSGLLSLKVSFQGASDGSRAWGVVFPK